ncbi:MAG TPA: DUF5103 domain-containing protein [Hanamia sp.]|nr:DUF5103 domain-containing protein [Hanamia sp.]
MKSSKVVFISLFFFAGNYLFAQAPDSIYVSNINTVRLFNTGNQLSLPVINLNGGNQVQLMFDDLDADVKDYYYTYQLCNSDWTPADLGQYDFIKGFTQERISDYRFSSIALTRYTHYQVTLPDGNMSPTRSGNYILKVFLNGDTSQLVFTKRLLVLDNEASINARIIQPFSPTLSTTHQKLQFIVNTKGLDGINVGQQIKVVILQNNRWDNAMTGLKPTFVRGTSLEYNSENTAVFPAGREWRWLDIRDFQLQSDRVLTADYKSSSTDIFLRPDLPLASQPYVYYKDLNGMSSIETTNGINPFYEGDYATVYFSFIPPNGVAYADKDIYLFGQLTNYSLTDSLKMIFNPAKRRYETHLFLKQGFYDYTYLAVDKNNPSMYSELDGNFFETENLYTILVYYKSFLGRVDKLIGMASFDSRADQPVLNF